MASSHDAGRFGVTYHHDARGVFFTVIDKWAAPYSNVVHATRSQDEAHRKASRLNEGTD